MITHPFILTLLFLCWGSFLNMLAYRLISGASLLTSRSYCPHCHEIIAWHDLIPVISYIFLRGSCRNCSGRISILYPLIEIITAISMLALYNKIPGAYFPAYFVYFSALIVTIRTDLQFMLVSRFASIYLIPVGIACSALGYLPITWQHSMLASMAGYAFLFVIAQVFYRITKKHGLGQGDVELIACIGAFTGILGWWVSIMFGSLLGSLLGIIYIITSGKDRSIKIPFGPFLAIASMIFVLFQYEITALLFPGL